MSEQKPPLTEAEQKALLAELVRLLGPDFVFDEADVEKVECSGGVETNFLDGIG